MRLRRIRVPMMALIDMGPEGVRQMEACLRRVFPRGWQTDSDDLGRTLVITGLRT